MSSGRFWILFWRGTRNGHKDDANKDDPQRELGWIESIMASFSINEVASSVEEPMYEFYEYGHGDQ